MLLTQDFSVRPELVEGGERNIIIKPFMVRQARHERLRQQH